MIYFKNGTLIVRFGGELGGLPHTQTELLFCDQLNDDLGILVPKFLSMVPGSFAPDSLSYM